MEQKQALSLFSLDTDSLRDASDNPPHKWPGILLLIQRELSKPSFETWFGAVRCIALDPQRLILGVPDAFFGSWLQNHYHDLIQSSAEEVLGSRPEISYQVIVTNVPSVSPSDTAAPKAQASQDPRELGLNPNYCFENFVVGPGSRFAYAAACAVAESPAKNYNPLFIYGRVGLGKTHLMQAIALEIKRCSPNKKIVYLSSERFTNELISAIQRKTTPLFRSRFRAVDLLLIDDIPFVAGKESTQEEFFHTFNALYDAHKQIVISSDRPPREIAGLEERLISRFGWGLVTDIQPPDFETRVAILRKKLETHPVTVPDNILFLIAEKIQSNVRELEGALVRVMAYSSLTGSEITLSLAQKTLGGSFREEKERVGVDAIQSAVAEVFGFRVVDLRAKRWTKSLAEARRVAIYLIREITGTSFAEIGGFFGGRDAATTLRAHREVGGKLRFEGNTKRIVESLRNRFV